MILVKMLDVFKNEGVIAPVSGMKITESNIEENSNILMTMGNREVEGFYTRGHLFFFLGAP